MQTIKGWEIRVVTMKEPLDFRIGEDSVNACQRCFMR